MVLGERRPGGAFGPGIPVAAVVPCPARAGSLRRTRRGPGGSQRRAGRSGDTVGLAPGPAPAATVGRFPPPAPAGGAVVGPPELRPGPLAAPGARRARLPPTQELLVLERAS